MGIFTTYLYTKLNIPRCR